jgi:hypothetical protein
MCIFVAEFDMTSMIPRADVEALQADHDKVLGELQVLEMAAIKLCQEIEGLECQTSGSSIANRLSSLGGRVIERLQGALRLGVQKALGLTSTHCRVNFNALCDGYIFPEGIEGHDAMAEAIKEANASVTDPAVALADLFDGVLFPKDIEREAAATPNPGAP